MHHVSKIQATKSRHSTRSSIDDAQEGKMIYLHASYLPALNFVSLPMDGVEPIDLVWEDETKKIWHCADIRKSIMLQKAIIVAWNEANGKKETIQDSCTVCEESDQKYCKRDSAQSTVSVSCFFVHSAIVRLCHCFQAS